MTILNTNTMHDLVDSQFWGPVTATLDWCEVREIISSDVISYHSLSWSTEWVVLRPQANYQFSRYVAELANTFSNIVTLGLAAYGGSLVSSAQLPPRYITGWLVRPQDRNNILMSIPTRGQATQLVVHRDSPSSVSAASFSMQRYGTRRSSWMSFP